MNRRPSSPAASMPSSAAAMLVELRLARPAGREGATDGSIARRSSKISRTNRSRGATAICQARTSGSSRFQFSAARTRVPVFGRDSTSPLLISTLVASRSTVRLTPSWAHHSASAGITVPGGNSPPTICSPTAWTTRPSRPRVEVSALSRPWASERAMVEAPDIAVECQIGHA